jgi:5-methylcytosine-specific restriction endonuclease McrA
MKEQILKLRAEGLSYREICARLDCSKSVVSYHCGDGQKVKTRIRAQKRRGRAVVDNKIYRFKNKKALRDKTNDFQRREGGKLKIRKIIFNYEDVMQKFGETPICYLTGREINLEDTKNYHFDHIIPATRGGSNDIDNLGLACKEANKAKSDMTINEFIQICKEVLEHNGYRVIK